LGRPALSWKNQAGVWLCHTSVWPTMNSPCRSPNATKASPARKSNTPGRGLTRSALRAFSTVMVLNCSTTMRPDAESPPATIASFTALPTVNAPA
jgi:hypothetical protein